MPWSPSPSVLAFLSPSHWLTFSPCLCMHVCFPLSEVVSLGFLALTCWRPADELTCSSCGHQTGYLRWGNPSVIATSLHQQEVLCSGFCPVHACCQCVLSSNLCFCADLSSVPPVTVKACACAHGHTCSSSVHSQKPWLKTLLFVFFLCTKETCK